jgi:hypothetical protein
LRRAMVTMISESKIKDEKSKPETDGSIIEFVEIDTPLRRAETAPDNLSFKSFICHRIKRKSIKVMNNTFVRKHSAAIDKHNVHTRFGVRKMIAADTTHKINMLSKIGLLNQNSRA